LLLFVPPTQLLRLLWDQLALALDLAAARQLAAHVLATPLAPTGPPLLPLFIHVVLPGVLDALDGGAPAAAELLAAVLATSLMRALQLERAVAGGAGARAESAPPLGEGSTSMARGLAAELRRRKGGAGAGLVAQRLASSKTFVTSFPVFKTEI
jgi:mediator of RNA polymerase II transcription subunit 5